MDVCACHKQESRQQGRERIASKNTQGLKILPKNKQKTNRKQKSKNRQKKKQKHKKYYKNDFFFQKQNTELSLRNSNVCGNVICLLFFPCNKSKNERSIFKSITTK